MKKEVIKEIFEYGPQKTMSAGLKYVELDNGEFVWGNGRILGLFTSNFEQFNDYAFGGKKTGYLYRFYKEDGTPLSKNLFREWQLIDDDEIKEKYRDKLNGVKDVLLVKNDDDDKWYFLFPNGEEVEEEYVWQE